MKLIKAFVVSILFVGLSAAADTVVSDETKMIEEFKAKVENVDKIKSYKVKFRRAKDTVSAAELTKIEQAVFVLSQMESLSIEMECKQDEWDEKLKGDDHDTYCNGIKDVRLKLVEKQEEHAKKVFGMSTEFSKEEVELYLRKLKTYHEDLLDKPSK